MFNLKHTVPLLLLLLLAASTDAYSADIKAYYNGQEATVRDAVLKQGDRFNIDLYITPERDATVHVLLYEPGRIEAFERISGGEKGRVITAHRMAGRTAHFRWRLVANDRWIGGTAPVNIAYKILEERDGPGKQLSHGEFTVVNARICGPGTDAGLALIITALAAVWIVTVILAVTGLWLPGRNST